MKTIGLISDTNGRLGSQVERFLRDCDVLWHCGDVGDRSALSALLKFGKPLLAVRGEKDTDPLFERNFRQYSVFTDEGMKFLVIHKGVDNTSSVPALYPEAVSLLKACEPDIIIFGHTEKWMDDSLILSDGKDKDTDRHFRAISPGAVNPSRKGPQSALKMKIEGGKVLSVERLEINYGIIKIFK